MKPDDYFFKLAPNGVSTAFKLMNNKMNWENVELSIFSAHIESVSLMQVLLVILIMQIIFKEENLTQLKKLILKKMLNLFVKNIKNTCLILLFTLNTTF